MKFRKRQILLWGAKTLPKFHKYSPKFHNSSSVNCENVKFRAIKNKVANCPKFQLVNLGTYLKSKTPHETIYGHAKEVLNKTFLLGNKLKCS